MQISWDEFIGTEIEWFPELVVEGYHWNFRDQFKILVESHLATHIDQSKYLRGTPRGGWKCCDDRHVMSQTRDEWQKLYREVLMEIRLGIDQELSLIINQQSA